MIHKLKTDPEQFQALKDGRKTFEIRKNDRGYQVGDELWLMELRRPDLYDFTGRLLALRCTYILHGPQYGLPEGYCIMSVERA